MLSLQQAKKILCSTGKNYSDEEVRVKLDAMYRLGMIQYDITMRDLQEFTEIKKEVKHAS